MKTLDIVVDDKPQSLLLPNYKHLKSIRKNLVFILSHWWGHTFSVADLLLEKKALSSMQDVVDCFPRQESPTSTGIDLELIGNDYDQLQKLFITQSNTQELHSFDVREFDYGKFEPSLISELLIFNHKLLLAEAIGQFESRVKAEVGGDGG